MSNPQENKPEQPTQAPKDNSPTQDEPKKENLEVQQEPPQSPQQKENESEIPADTPQPSKDTGQEQKPQDQPPKNDKTGEPDTSAMLKTILQKEDEKTAQTEEQADEQKPQEPQKPQDPEAPSEKADTQKDEGSVPVSGLEAVKRLDEILKKYNIEKKKDQA